MPNKWVLESRLDGLEGCAWSHLLDCSFVPYFVLCSMRDTLERYSQCPDGVQFGDKSDVRRSNSS